MYDDWEQVVSDEERHGSDDDHENDYTSLKTPGVLLTRFIDTPFSIIDDINLDRNPSFTNLERNTSFTSQSSSTSQRAINFSPSVAELVDNIFEEQLDQQSAKSNANIRPRSSSDISITRSPETISHNYDNNNNNNNTNNNFNKQLAEALKSQGIHPNAIFSPTARKKKRKGIASSKNKNSSSIKDDNSPRPNRPLKKRNKYRKRGNSNVEESSIMNNNTLRANNNNQYSSDAHRVTLLKNKPDADNKQIIGLNYYNGTNYPGDSSSNNNDNNNNIDKKLNINSNKNTTQNGNNNNKNTVVQIEACATSSSNSSSWASELLKLTSTTTIFVPL